MREPVTSGNEAPLGALGALDEIFDLLTHSEFDLEKLLNEIVRTTAELMDLRASAIRLLDEDTRELVLRAVYGLSSEFLAAAPTFDTESRFARLIENKGILNIQDVLEEPDLRFTKAAQFEGIRSLLAIGLYAQDELLGALSVYRTTPQAFSDTEVQSLTTIAKQVALAVKIARLHEAQAEKDRLERELSLAGEIQQRVLPTTNPEFPGFEIAASYEPWDRIGGDFYDFIDLPEGNLGIVVADVSGKGIWAALLMFEIRTALRAHAAYQYSVEEIVGRVNRQLFRDTEAEQFGTLVYGVLNARGRFFTYVNAANPAPLLVRDGKVLALDSDDLPVGILDDTDFEREIVQLEPNDRLVLYSDGYFEIFNEDGEMFGEARFRECVGEAGHLEPKAFIDALNAKVDRFLGSSQDGDDRTLVIVKVL